jgi:hypothetical protein
MWSEAKDDLIEKGYLFGYPKDAVKAYSSHENMTVIIPSNFHQYWAPYVRYLVRADHIHEDTLIAKNWADIIRNDIPELASQFEDSMVNVTIR